MANDFDVIIVGGGIAGSTLGMVLARSGMQVLVLERDSVFRDRVRGEYMHPWGVTEAKTLGIYDLLMQTCGHEARYRFSHVIGMPGLKQRDLVTTSPHKSGSLHFYHPAMQEVLLEAARQAGARVLRGVPVAEVLPGKPPGVRLRQGESDQAYRARLVVGADGRNSACRKWGRFRVHDDPNRMVIAGTLYTNLDAPEDTVNYFVNPEQSAFAVFTPLGGKKFRTYAGFHQLANHRRLSGEKDVPAYQSHGILAGVPQEWFAVASASGPLASFNCAESWVESPYQDGIALVGDAAAISDPTYGCGLSLALRDVRVLSGNLLASPDWEGAAQAYGAEHDHTFQAVHTMVDWMTRIYFEPGEGQAIWRQKIFERIRENPRRVPDLPGLGPEAPSDEAAYRELFGEE